MQFKKKPKQKGIILIISSFNQLYNFLSFFIEKKMIGTKKIILIIFSDTIPDKLISNLKNFIEKFTSIEVIQIRRKSIKFNKRFINIRILNILLYYLFLFKKIFEIKKKYTIPYILTNSKIQIPTFFLISIMTKSKLFFVEDGFGDYVYDIKNKTFINLSKIFMFLNRSRIFILQLAKSKKDYLGLLNLIFSKLNQNFIKDKNYYDNRKSYKNFLVNISKKKLPFNPKCIIIGTKCFPHNFDYNKNLYFKTLSEIKKKYAYTPEQILFFPHHRETPFYLDQFIKSFSGFSNIHTDFSIVVENYLSQTNLETIIGNYSSVLYYAKTLFNKKHIYYIENFRDPSDSEEFNYNTIRFFNSLGINNFFK